MVGMRGSYVIFAILFATVALHAAEERVLSGTTSPNKEIVVVEVLAADGQSDFYFVDRLSGKRLGFVLPREQRRQISKVGIVAKWNKSSTRVAMMVYYGTKLSELLIHSRGRDGAFHEVELEAPDPLELYQKRTGKRIASQGDGYSDNSVGPWLDEDTVLLMSGEAKQVIPPGSETEDVDLGQYAHVYATFRAKIRGRTARVSDLRLIGPLTNKESGTFKKQWEARYLSGGD